MKEEGEEERIRESEMERRSTRENEGRRGERRKTNKEEEGKGCGGGKNREIE